MSGAAPGAMDISKVVKERKFNSGGQGSVWAVKDRTINGVWPVAYKEYHQATRGQLKADVLAQMVGFMPDLPRGTGQWLAECSAWPAALVKDSAGVSGFLMRQIPPRFFRELNFEPGVKKPAGFQYLLNSPGYLKNAGIPLSHRHRFELLLDFARILGRLHSLGVVVGDMSPNNVLFTLEGTPACFLIDCDAMLLNGRWALPPVETPGWQLRQGERLGSARGDAYKFGLLAARLFHGEQHGEDLTSLRQADAAVGALAERSLWADPVARPTLEEWVPALANAAATAPTTVGVPSPRRPRAATPTQTQAQTQTAPRPRPTTVAAAPAPQPPAKGRFGRWWAGLVGLALVAVLFGPQVYEWAGDAVAGESGVGTRSAPGGAGSGGGGGAQDSATPGSVEGQARALEGLLKRNEGNRGSVVEAVRLMTSCPGDSRLREAKRALREAAEERDALVRDLSALDVSLLPSSTTSSLRVGWEASADADRAYARVAEELRSGCSAEALRSSTPWQEAAEASGRATAAKKEFVADWNPLARKYGLTTMTEGEV
ncbi:hypothetical protein [Streptomyces purpureus]|uniref:Protein kinase domain-containing protein n=1 Tax=Streptomyces purpureus TaxID=1951 RepID=A0A918H4U5_9ACTN|nr:hypothetical protein [Streptomyces purpureus]GGT34363.1 hypothetical protein GCM10014713_29950 [Streptomyces purpureus]